MEFVPEQLNKFNTPIQDFFKSLIISERTIRLPLILGTKPRQVTVHVDFLVLNLPSAYNAILSRPNLGALKAVVSSYHLMIKFSTEAGAGQDRGNQAMARQCFAAKLRAKEQPVASQPKLPIGLDTCDDLTGEHARPSKDLVEVPLRKKNLHQIVKIRSSINQTVADMSGIDSEVMTHHLGVDPTFCPIKKKKRSFALEYQKAITEEMDKLVKAGFIREAMYPDWLANDDALWAKECKGNISVSSEQDNQKSN
ncbi:uncharacterized protein [Elaeis guineensis]|uniref:uncharacterized protein n=1 Tax=Elaeis guineensis var. tenera TaxID=51953 RepID=UPI003C6D6167